MKIAFLAEYLVSKHGKSSGISGGNRRILEIANGLVEKGHEVDILIVLDDVPLECNWMKVKANIKHISDRTYYDVAVMNHAPVWMALNNVQADLKVYYWLGFEASYFSQPTWYDAYQQPYFIIANSEWVADCAEMIYGKRPPVVLGGIDKKLFYPVKVYREYDLVSLAPEWSPEKGYFHIKRTAEIMKLSWYNIQGIPQNQMAEAYSKGHVYLGMPESEGFYNPPLEAMACGVPVILTDACGNMDYARHEENCLLIPKNVGAAMKAVRRLLRTDGRRSKLAHKLIKNGFETAKQYEWSKAVDRFEEVITGAYRNNRS